MHFVYILYSEKTNHFYVGETPFPEGRLGEHRSGKYKGASTKFTDDWTLVKSIELRNRKDALKVERYIKSMKSARFINSLIHDSNYYRNFMLIVKQKFNIEIVR